MKIQTRHSNWIEKNWKFKQNIQIELKKIENSNKTFKLNWKKIENSNNIIKLNWKKFELQIYGSVWFEIIWSFSQYMTKLIWIELNVESLIWAALFRVHRAGSQLKNVWKSDKSWEPEKIWKFENLKNFKFLKKKLKFEI